MTPNDEAPRAIPPYECDHGTGWPCVACLRESGVDVQTSTIMAYVQDDDGVVVKVAGGRWIQGEAENNGLYLSDWCLPGELTHPVGAKGLMVWVGDVWWDTPDPVYGEADIHYLGTWRIPTDAELLELRGVVERVSEAVDAG